MQYIFNPDDGLEMLLSKLAGIADKVSKVSSLVSRSLDVGVQYFCQVGLFKVKTRFELDLIQNGHTGVDVQLIDHYPLNWAEG